MSEELPQLDVIEAAIAKLIKQLACVGTETVAIGQVAGRVLGQPLLADRDSPPLDVSAMDGYAIRIEDASTGIIPVSGVAAAGSQPPELLPGHAVRIFTGAPVPAGAECVVMREHTEETPDSIRLCPQPRPLTAGAHIRRQGENIRQGDEVLPAGYLASSSAMASIASFGVSEVEVRRRVRVSILNTGDELVAAGEHAEPWQIRDSNGPTLESWIRNNPWLQLQNRIQVRDEPQFVESALREAADHSDAVILTGGVSMGDADYVPGAIESLGGEIVFHRLPLRPGKPILGAVLDGKLVLGLPGNPQSVAVTSRVFGDPLLRHMAGMQSSCAVRPKVQLQADDGKRLDLTWFRLVEVDGAGDVTFVETRGSGDPVALARSVGFVEIPPGEGGPGPWRFYRWD